MAKPTAKPAKTTKTATPEIAPEKKARKGGAVLVFKTAAEIKDLIGPDVKIGVSKKSLTNAVFDAKREEIVSGI